MKPKKYDSVAWLQLQYKIKHRTPAEIAAECRVSERTIYNALERHKLL